MHNILCLNKISPLGTDRLGKNYHTLPKLRTRRAF